MADSVLVGIPSHQLCDIWDRVEPFIVSACARSNGKYLPADVAKALLARDMQLWTSINGETVEAILVTQIVNYPRKRVCQLLIATGEDAEHWTPFIEQIEEWAKEQGCQAVEPVPRPGWERILKRYGYEKTHVFLWKDL